MQIYVSSYSSEEGLWVFVECSSSLLVKCYLSVLTCILECSKSSNGDKWGEIMGNKPKWVKIGTNVTKWMG